MCCSCSCSEDNCVTIVTIRVLPILLGLALVFGVITVLAGVRLDTVTPALGKIPILMLATAVTVWGMWLGYRIHGRGEPLAVAAFGFLVSVAGYILGAPITLVGVCILVAAAVWSAKARPSHKGA